MSFSELFRPEAVQAWQHRLYGEVVLATPASRVWWSCLIGGVVALVLAVLLLGQYPRTETVRGWLQPDRGVVQILAPADAVVAALPAAEGAALPAGAPLAQLQLVPDLPQGQAVAARLLQDQQREQQQLQQQLEAAQAGSQARRRQLQALLSSLEAELAQFKRQLDAVERRAALLQRQRDEQADLVRQGYIARRDADKLDESLLAQAELAESIRQDRVAKETAWRSAQHELAALAPEREAALAALGERQAALAQRQGEQTRRAALQLSAPVAGQLANLRAPVGTAVRAGAVLAELLPEGSQLQAELFAPSRAAGFVRPGDRVLLRFDAYPAHRFGISQGQVISVARSAAAPQALPRGVASDEPVYRILVSLPAQPISQPGPAGRAPEMRAGMTLQADIVLESRSLIAALWAPLWQAWRGGA